MAVVRWRGKIAELQARGADFHWEVHFRSRVTAKYGKQIRGIPGFGQVCSLFFQCNDLHEGGRRTKGFAYREAFRNVDYVREN